jgi:hypothetical protein
MTMWAKNGLIIFLLASFIFDYSAGVRLDILAVGAVQKLLVLEVKLMFFDFSNSKSRADSGVELSHSSFNCAAKACHGQSSAQVLFMYFFSLFYIFQYQHQNIFFFLLLKSHQ